MQHFITAVIVINAITLGLETSATIMASIGALLLLLDKAALIIFVVEILMKLIAYRWSFFRNGWNLFDLGIVSISLLPGIATLSVLRALRILRLLRLFSVIPSLRVVVQSLLRAIPGMSSIMLVLGLIFYVGAVLTTKLFGTSFDDLFGSIDRSAFSLFQLMTLDGWSDGIVRPVLAQYPLAGFFFFPFIIITSFAVLNLFIGVLVSSIEQPESRSAPENSELVSEISALRQELSDVRQLLEKRQVEA
jgi:voltage-gated sodium channel